MMRPRQPLLLDLADASREDRAVVSRCGDEAVATPSGQGGKYVMPVDPGRTWAAERLLHDLAMRLCTLRFDERARALHGRVLELERAVALWTDDAPDDLEREAVCRELRTLREDAQSWIDRIRRPTLLFPKEAPRRREY